MMMTIMIIMKIMMISRPTPRLFLNEHSDYDDVGDDHSYFLQCEDDLDRDFDDVGDDDILAV